MLVFTCFLLHRSLHIERTLSSSMAGKEFIGLHSLSDMWTPIISSTKTNHQDKIFIAATIRFPLPDNYKRFGSMELTRIAFLSPLHGDVNLLHAGNGRDSFPLEDVPFPFLA